MAWAKWFLSGPVMILSVQAVARATSGCTDGGGQLKIQGHIPGPPSNIHQGKMGGFQGPKGARPWPPPSRNDSQDAHKADVQMSPGWYQCLNPHPPAFPFVGWQRFPRTCPFFGYDYNSLRSLWLMSDEWQPSTPLNHIGIQLKPHEITLNPPWKRI